jgi:diguanylate cyclase (GGDEF)-like protein
MLNVRPILSYGVVRSLMNRASKSFEDTTTLQARVVARRPRAVLFAALSRIAEPQLLIPAGALVILGLIWATTFHMIGVEKANAQHAASVSTRDLLDTYESQVVRALREIDQTLKFVQYAASVKGDRAALAELQTRSLLPPNLVFVVSVADTRGAVIASTAETHSDSAPARAHFMASPDKSSGAGGELWMDPPRRDPRSGDWTMQFSRRLSAPDGAYAGVVTMDVDAAYFASGYDTAKLGRHGVLGVLGTDGIFIVRRTGDAISAGDSTDYTAVVAPGGGDDEAAVTLTVNAWDGVRRFTGARELYAFPLAVIVGLSEEEQLTAWAANRSAALQRAALGSVVVILLATVLFHLGWQLLQSRQRESEAQIAYAKRVEYLAYHDGLCGLPNRSLFSRLLTRGIKLARRHQHQLAVLFLDIDRFKQINDTLGHDAGDNLLRELAIRLQSCLRDSDTVARLGGDEFVVLLPDLESAGSAALVAQKILTALTSPFVLAGQAYRITASIGICAYPQDGEDEQTLTKHADIAMYQAKAEGKNTFQFYSEKLNSNSLERLTLETSLRQALPRREFFLMYEARRDLVSDRINAVEAQLRWQHPVFGTMLPHEFVGVAEETGLMVPIGIWMLTEACAQGVAWQGEALPDIRMAVNLTPRQFADEGFVGDVARILQETGMPPRTLELEITESLLMRDVEKTLRIMTALRNLGVRFAVRNFGATYSMLSRQRRFPLDTVKIDLSGVSHAPAGPNSGAAARDHSVADAIIAMGRSLSLTVLTQGVETWEAEDRLPAHARDELQSSYSSRPLPAAEVTLLLRRQRELAETLTS